MGYRYKGTAYYFCDKAAINAFLKDPDGFLPLPVPRPAPAVSFKSLAGEAVKLTDLKGKVVLMDFWATWCKPCVEGMPGMQKLHDKYAAKGLTVLGPSVDEEGAKKVEPFLAKRKLTYQFALAGENGSKAFRVCSIPALFLIDKDGKVVKQWTGKPNEKEVEAVVSDLLR